MSSCNLIHLQLLVQLLWLQGRFVKFKNCGLKNLLQCRVTAWDNHSWKSACDRFWATTMRSVAQPLTPSKAVQSTLPLFKRPSNAH